MSFKVEVFLGVDVKTISGMGKWPLNSGMTNSGLLDGHLRSYPCKTDDCVLGTETREKQRVGPRCPHMSNLSSLTPVDGHKGVIFGSKNGG